MTKTTVATLDLKNNSYCRRQNCFFEDSASFPSFCNPLSFKNGSVSVRSVASSEHLVTSIYQTKFYEVFKLEFFCNVAENSAGHSPSRNKPQKLSPNSTFFQRETALNLLKLPMKISIYLNSSRGCPSYSTISTSVDYIRTCAGVPKLY